MSTKEHFFKKKINDTKSHKSKDRQYNDQMIEDKSTMIYKENNRFKTTGSPH
jgi:hypothetical protein